MPSRWLKVPLADYEGHMNAPQVAQLATLAHLFAQALAEHQPESLAIVGIAGGNGLDHIDRNRTRRIVGLDVCQSYLDAAGERYADLPGLELHCADLAEIDVRIEPVHMVHAALVFEHAGAGRCLDNALALVKPGGAFVAVLQLPSESAAGVGPTGFDSLQNLAPDFQLIDPAWFTQAVTRRGLTLQSESRYPVASGKALWMGTFRSIVT